MISGPIAELPGGVEVHQTFVPSSGAHRYSPTTPADLERMCYGTYLSWCRLISMYPYALREDDQPIWDVQLWESRSATSFAMVDWLKEEYVVCRLRRPNADPVTARQLARAKMYLFLCEVDMAKIGAIAVQRSVRGTQVAPNQVAITREDWAEAAHLDRDVLDLPEHTEPTFVLRPRRRASI